MDLLDLIFPKHCLACNASHNYLCLNCFDQIDLFPPQRCSVCNQRSISGYTHSRCQTSWGIDGIWAMAKHKGIMKKLIYKWKYGFTEDLTQIFGKLLKKYVPNNFKSFDLIIPVPLHKSRLRWRGYNQSAKLGKKLATELNLTYQENILTRKRITIPQMKIKQRRQRLVNLKNNFQISATIEREKLKDKSILLIDDIVTTGATLREATMPLKRAGAKKVWGIVLAR